MYECYFFDSKTNSPLKPEYYELENPYIVKTSTKKRRIQKIDPEIIAELRLTLDEFVKCSEKVPKIEGSVEQDYFHPAETRNYLKIENPELMAYQKLVETDENSASFHQNPQDSGSSIYLKPFSMFYISSQQQFNTHKMDAPYDLILMDPPWPNKSIRRKRNYETYDQKFQTSTKKPNCQSNSPLESLLADFDFNELASKYVCIWITNAKRIENFVKTDFCEKNDLELEMEIYWMKVTKNSKPVCPIDSIHKKPYEKLLVLKKKSLKKNEDFGSIKKVDPVVIFSVPSSFHSQKPFLHDWLKNRFSSKKPLELFSRFTVGNGWTNWGNEPLNFNEIRYLKTRENTPDKSV